jgi:hypothetical protein
MAKNNELKAYIVATNTDLTAVTMARTKEEAVSKARVYFRSMHEISFADSNIEAYLLDEYQVVEVK